MQQDIHYLNDEWVFWYAIRGKLAKDAEHYECTDSLTQRISRTLGQSIPLRSSSSITVS